MKIKISKSNLDKQPKKYVRLILAEDKPSWHRLVETKTGQLEYRMGAGKYEDMTQRKFRLFIRSIVQVAKTHQLEYLAIDTNILPRKGLGKNSDDWFFRTLAENLHLAAYEFSTYKSKKNEKDLKEVVICGGMSAAEKRSFSAGEIVAEATNTARDIINTPACDMTPKDLAKAAKTAVVGTKATVKVLGEKELKKLKMGALLAVGRGSENESQLIVIEYYGAGKKAGKPIVLAGKGITYDTGGLIMKPVGGFGMMQDMHMDMSGGGAVIGAIAAIAKLKLKKNVVAIIPAAENAVSDKAMRPGDIVRSMSGKTIEVVHPDAEGRMVLADALTYSERYQPKLILDIAGLTGAAIGALGHHASAVMSKDHKLQNQLCEVGEEAGDLMWPLPLWDEYQSLVKSHKADIANLNTSYSRFGGAIEGGIFISHFVPKGVKWAHLDIAPRMIAVSADKLAKGATGEPVRMLVRFIEQN